MDILKIIISESLSPKHYMEIKKPIEWMGAKTDENGEIFAEWKTYIDTEEANGTSFKRIKTYFSEKMKNTCDGWNELEYPEIGDVAFSEAEFPEVWEKENDEVIEISYRIYFNEVI